MNTKPDHDSLIIPSPDFQFSDLFELEDMQRLQDLFADAHCVGSIITHPDGTPITAPSNFSHLCSNIIRKTEKGLANCIKSDAGLGRYNPDGPTIRPCLSCGLWEAGASITVGGKHIANWLIGQVRIADMDEQRLVEYANEIGANKQDYTEALEKVPVLSAEHFRKVSKMLFELANKLSENAYRNLQLKLQIAERDKAYALLQEKEEQSRHISSTIFDISYSCRIDRNGKSSIDWITGAVERITGYPVEEIIAMKCWGKLVLDEDFDLFKKNVLDLAPGTSATCELRLRHKSGAIVWVKSFAEKFDSQEKSDKVKFYGALAGITEEKRTELAIKETKERLELVLDNTPIAIWDWNLETDTWIASGKYYTMLGYETEKGGSSRDVWIERIHPDDRASVQSKIMKVLHHIDDDYTYDARMLHADGSYRWQTVIGHVLSRNRSGKATRMLGVRIDIHERKRAEEALNESVQMFQRLFNASPDAVVLIDPHHTSISWPIVDCNEACCAMNGYSREELIGQSVDLINIAEEATEYRQGYLNKLRQVGVLHIGSNHRHKDGHIFPVEISITIVNIGGREMVLGIDRDVTERKIMEKELIEAKEKAENSRQQLVIRNEELVTRNKFIQTILDNLPIGIALNKIDEGTATYMNKKFEEVYGWGANDILSLASFFEHVYPDAEYREKLVKQIMEDIQSGDLDRMHWENIFVTRKDGSTRVVNAVNIPLFEQNTMVSVVIDITDLHKTQNDLLKEKEKAEESDKLKSAFLANMSHEIRTPLNSIIGFSELLLDPYFKTQKHDEFVKLINASGNNLLTIISDIMDISKIEAGQIHLEWSVFSIQHLVEDIRQEYSFKANEKGIELRLDPLNPKEEILIESDQNKLRQVLINFVSNALKFTDKGFVELGIKNNDGYIHVQVKDSGIGISKEYHRKIFERFRQVESAESRKYGGTGLGLAISKSLVEILGGKIGMESEYGEGSVFYVEIPLHTNNAE